MATKAAAGDATGAATEKRFCATITRVDDSSRQQRQQQEGRQTQRAILATGAAAVEVAIDVASGAATLVATGAVGVVAKSVVTRACNDRRGGIGGYCSRGSCQRSRDKRQQEHRR